MKLLDHCIVCGCHKTYPLYAAQNQPLVALGLPKSQDEALAQGRFELDFHQCAGCGHVYNRRFDESLIPYAEDSNLMYNASSLWQDHLRDLAQKIAALGDLTGKTVVDIGCGDGRFLHQLKALCPGMRAIGFEPGIEVETARSLGVECYQDYFVAARDLPLYKPDVILCRHVVEHLSAPRMFMADISYEASALGLNPLVIIEVPRIDKALETVRINDLFYEHVSHFTRASFEVLFTVTHYQIQEIMSSYDDEVLVGLVRPAWPMQIQKTATQFHQTVVEGRKSIQEQLHQQIQDGKTIAFWGGTGKGASFLNAYNLKADQFPVVVDSDARKVGRFVPGTGQQICAPDVLHTHPADIIVITTWWRARDIYAEIQQRGIVAKQIIAIKKGHFLEIESPEPM